MLETDIPFSLRFIDSSKS